MNISIPATLRIVYGPFASSFVAHFPGYSQVSHICADNIGHPPIQFHDRGERFAVKNILDYVVAKPVGAFVLLAFAAFLEALGDSFFQSGLYRASGAMRALFLVLGIIVLALYGLTVNAPRWDFGRLLGIYVVLFFVVAQILARVRFHQSPTLPIYVGGVLIVSGGILIACWKP